MKPIVDTQMIGPEDKFLPSAYLNDQFRQASLTVDLTAAPRLWPKDIGSPQLMIFMRKGNIEFIVSELNQLEAAKVSNPIVFGEINGTVTVSDEEAAERFFAHLEHSGIKAGNKEPAMAGLRWVAKNWRDIRQAQPHAA